MSEETIETMQDDDREPRVKEPWRPVTIEEALPQVVLASFSSAGTPLSHALRLYARPVKIVRRDKMPVYGVLARILYEHELGCRMVELARDAGVIERIAETDIAALFGPLSAKSAARVRASTGTVERKPRGKPVFVLDEANLDQLRALLQSGSLAGQDVRVSDDLDLDDDRLYTDEDEALLTDDEAMDARDEAMEADAPEEEAPDEPDEVEIALEGLEELDVRALTGGDEAADETAEEESQSPSESSSIGFPKSKQARQPGKPRNTTSNGHKPRGGRR